MKITQKIRKHWLVYMFMLLLAGCYSPQASRAIKPTPVRDLLLSGEKAPEGYGAYGYLIFTKRPSENDLLRYIAVCNSFICSLEPASKYSPSVSPLLMPTFWLAENNEILTKLSPNCSQSEDSCQYWIKYYDYARAKVFASAVSMLDAKGPVLVAWSQPFENVVENEMGLVLDLSDFSNEDIDRAFRIWMDRITRDPAIWRDGFKIILIRETFRNFLEKYGGQIVRSIKAAKDIVG